MPDEQNTLQISQKSRLRRVAIQADSSENASLRRKTRPKSTEACKQRLFIFPRHTWRRNPCSARIRTPSRSAAEIMHSSGSPSLARLTLDAHDPYAAMDTRACSYCPLCMRRGKRTPLLTGVSGFDHDTPPVSNPELGSGTPPQTGDPVD